MISAILKFLGILQVFYFCLSSLQKKPYLFSYSLPPTKKIHKIFWTVLHLYLPIMLFVIYQEFSFNKLISTSKELFFKEFIHMFLNGLKVKMRKKHCTTKFPNSFYSESYSVDFIWNSACIVPVSFLQARMECSVLWSLNTDFIFSYAKLAF